MEKKVIKINENTIRKLVLEALNDYNAQYEELIKTEMHNLVELEKQVPIWLKPEIHDMVVKIESILSEIKANREMQTY